MSAAGGSDLFESYEQDLNQLTQSINQKVTVTVPGQSGEERKVTLRAVDRELEEADEILAQMDMEIVNMPTALRTRLSARMRAYRNNLDKLKRDTKRAASRMNGAIDREELLGGTTVGDLDSASSDQRQRLLAGTERLTESSRRLQDSHRVALETETIGANVLEDIRRQREQILHTRDNLLEADTYIDKAQRTLKDMAHRMAAHRLWTIAIVTILVLLILFVLYMKIFH